MNAETMEWLEQEIQKASGERKSAFLAVKEKVNADIDAMLQDMFKEHMTQTEVERELWNQSDKERL